MPPALSGGTLAVLPDGKTAIVSDPDRDLVWVVPLSGSDAPVSLPLRAGDEPGRIAIERQDRVHVVARGTGDVISFDPDHPDAATRQTLCAAARGIAWDARARSLHVACAEGDVVTLPADGGAPRRRFVARDLRDVVVAAGSVYITTFRSVDVYKLDPNGSVKPVFVGQRPTPEPIRTAAWRAVPVGQSVLILAQSTSRASIDLAPPVSRGFAYGASTPEAPPIVLPSAILAAEGSGAPVVERRTLDAGLAVDLAVSPDGRRFAVAYPGWAFQQGMQSVSEFTGLGLDLDSVHSAGVLSPPSGQTVAVAYTPDGALLVQTRAPASLYLRGPTPRRIALGDDDPVGDAGHDLFHATTPSGLACASCHPEGGDDGRAWRFVRLGDRRTPSLRGGLAATAPFHWDGEFATLASLVDTVWTRRMGGPPAAPAQSAALLRWLDALPLAARPAPGDPAAAARGEALFRDQRVGCASCHAGEHLTNNASVGVGTGGEFQVPSLRGLALRAPYMHTGCATTLTERFTDPACGGATHGAVDGLAPGDVADLVAWLETQ
jgi:hypothetical protein